MEKTGVVNGRFQVLHLKHMEYILAAKMRCRKLYIGLTNPDSLHTRESVNDENRSARSANPLTYFERYQMIRGAMKEFHVPESEYDILPFPINCPEYLLQYVPKDAVYYMGLCDEWDEEKYKILRSLGLKVEILWRKTLEEKGRYGLLGAGLHRGGSGVGPSGTQKRVRVSDGEPPGRADQTAGADAAG